MMYKVKIETNWSAFCIYCQNFEHAETISRLAALNGNAATIYWKNDGYSWEKVM